MLRIGLRDGERVIINGAVLRAQGRVTLAVETASAVLRGRDVMRAEEANTPARRLYFACMMAYIEPEAADRHRQAIAARAGELFAALAHPEMRAACLAVIGHGGAGDFYAALAECRRLVQYEGELLAPGDAA
ncbi:flagellar biosynthesis repressor FlbT [Sphingomonas morindae]|uniref:Flagellar biosynthesis repressor FlbT n=1 Tax=Sphingomonas morindae TaxID=1541170 RepID=A0ABY4X543_9SPHN|nr:flagellar biosynthesis repressor FlbT [Sphingomonas morindae]USI72014.1 flagellar biosynthesis repressor FlbT [Sphingomonas morindae]